MCIKGVWLVVAILSVPAIRLCAAENPSGCDSQRSFAAADRLLQNKQYEAAAKTLEQLRPCQLSAMATFRLGWLYGRARHFQAALDVFRTVPQDVPSRPAHRYAVALSQFELGDYRAAASTLQTDSADDLDPESANLLAVAYSKLGRFQDAYATLSQEIQHRPEDLAAHLNLVTVCAEGGDFQQAAVAASSAAHLFPKSPDVFVIKGAADLLLGHLEQASMSFSAASQLDPARPDAVFFLALTDYKQEKFADAITILRAATARGLADSDLYYLMAECLLKNNPADEAETMTELNRAIALNSTAVPARILRGRLLMEAGHPEKALPDLELAVRCDPQSRAANYQLARAYRALGKTEQARTLFARLRGQLDDSLAQWSDKKLNDTLTGKGLQP